MDAILLGLALSGASAGATIALETAKISTHNKIKKSPSGQNIHNPPQMDVGFPPVQRPTCLHDTSVPLHKQPDFHYAVYEPKIYQPTPSFHSDILSSNSPTLNLPTFQSTPYKNDSLLDPIYPFK